MRFSFLWSDHVAFSLTIPVVHVVSSDRCDLPYGGFANSTYDYAFIFCGYYSGHQDEQNKIRNSTAHEIGHQFGLDSNDNGHVDLEVECPNHEGEDNCIMTYEKDTGNDKCEFCYDAEDEENSCIYDIRTKEDGF